MTYNIYIYAYTHINIISSLMKFEGIKWLALSKYTQKWSTEIEGLRDANIAQPSCKIQVTYWFGFQNVLHGRAYNPGGFKFDCLADIILFI